MKKTDIMSIINKVNTNKNIRWSISKNTDTEIILTNSYDTAIKYSIKVKSEDGEEWITVRNEHMNTRCGMLLQGEDRWSDYTDTERGLEMGIETAVMNFNSRY